MQIAEGALGPRVAAGPAADHEGREPHQHSTVVGRADWSKWCCVSCADCDWCGAEDECVLPSLASAALHWSPPIRVWLAVPYLCCRRRQVVQ